MIKGKNLACRKILIKDKVEGGGGRGECIYLLKVEGPGQAALLYFLDVCEVFYSHSK